VGAGNSGKATCSKLAEVDSVRAGLKGSFSFDDECRALQQEWFPAKAEIELQFIREWAKEKSALPMAARCAWLIMMQPVPAHHSTKLKASTERNFLEMALRIESQSTAKQS